MGLPSVKCSVRTFQWLIAVGLLAALGWLLYRNGTELSSLLTLSVGTIAVVISARLIAYLLLVEAAGGLTRVFAPHLGHLEYLVVSSSGSILGHFGLPGSSYAAKTIYLNKRHGVEHASFFSVSVVVGLLTIATSGVVALVGLGILLLQSSNVSPLFWIGVATMLAAPMMVLRINGLFAALTRFKRLRGLEDSWRCLRATPRSLYFASSILLLRGVCTFVGFGFLFMALADDAVGFIMGGVIDALSSFLRVVWITPGNLGVYEWFIAVLGHSAGEALSKGLVAAAIYRLAGIIAIAAAALVALGLQGITPSRVPSAKRS